MGLSSWDIDHLQDIFDGNGEWFTAQLMRLIAKADGVNLEKLRMAYPDEVRVYEEWHQGLL
jgi:hypothetical protein